MAMSRILTLAILSTDRLPPGSALQSRCSAVIECYLHITVGTHIAIIQEIIMVAVRIIRCSGRQTHIHKNNRVLFVLDQNWPAY